MEKSTSSHPGTGIVYAFFFVVGVLFLALIPVVTEPGPQGQGWWTQPAFMPRLSLILIAGPALYMTIQHFWPMIQDRSKRPDRSDVNAELLQWVKPTEFFIYYVIYIFLLGLVGYFLSSLIFVLGLSWRVGLRGRRWGIIAVITAVGLIVVFRWGLRVWIDPPLLFDIFPRSIRLFLSRYF